MRPRIQEAGDAVDTANAAELARRVLDTANDAFISIDAGTRVLQWNAQAEVTFGWSRPEVLGRPLDELIIPERFAEAHRKGLARFLETGEGPILFKLIELTARRRTGEEFPIELTISPLLTSDGWVFNAFLRDIGDRYRGLAAISQLASIVESSEDAIFSTDIEGKVVTWNAAAARLYGFSAAEVIGQPATMLVEPSEVERIVELIGRALAGEHVVGMETLHLTKSGAVTPVAATISPVRDDEDRVIALSVVARDISERKRLEAELVRARDDALHRATHDDLTGLPNRAAFIEEIRAGAGGFTVVVYELPSFREVTDALGEEAGDELLRAIAARLTQAHTGLLARLEGASFAIALPSYDEEDVRRIQRVLNQPVSLFGVHLGVETFAGVAIASARGTEAGRLLNRAARAARAAYSERAGLLLFDERLAQPTADTMELSAELPQAIADGQLELFFQPQVELATQRISGFEGLVRWRHPKRGLLSPAMFIEQAERSAVIRDLTLSAIDQAARFAHGCSAGTTVSVNLSVAGLLDLRIAHDIAEALVTHRLRPALLNLEVTESAIMTDPRRAGAVLAGLHAMGVALSIDDFGTGHSSLAYLQRLPVDELKVDQSFVGRMLADDRSAAIVRAVVELGSTFGLRTVAEGVEDRATADALSAIGCDVIQGYLLSPALPVAEANAWSEAWSGLPD